MKRKSNRESLDFGSIGPRSAYSLSDFGKFGSKSSSSFGSGFDFHGCAEVP